MARTAQALVLLAVAALSTAAMLKVECERPPTREECEELVGNYTCPPLDREECARRGGRPLPSAGPCGQCDLCAEMAGGNVRCNVDVSIPGTYPKFGVCGRPLVCSKRFEGRCVLADNCIYKN